MTICHRDFIAGLGAAAWPLGPAPISCVGLDPPSSARHSHNRPLWNPFHEAPDTRRAFRRIGGRRRRRGSGTAGAARHGKSLS